MTVRDFSFLEDVMGQLLERLHKSEESNYDARRFSFDGVDRSTVFNLEYHKQNLCFFIANDEKFKAALNLLADEASRALFLELILFRLAGHLHVRLSTNTSRYWQLREQAFAIPSQPSRFDFTSQFGPLRHFEDVPCNGRKFSLDCWPDDIASTFFIKQYHLERGGVHIFPKPEDHVIDAGSCFGDTAVAFAGAVGPGGRVYAFDPLQSHGEIVRHNIGQNHLDKAISFFPVGLGARPNATPGPVLEETVVNPGFRLARAKRDDEFPVRTIDSLVAAKDIQRVDFLKMDIEGSELAALQGAEETLRQFKPRLAISIYHKFGDFFEIPLYLHGLSLGYRFYLNHYTIYAEETVLYAISD
jgi:FkbM family methyltransferase